MRQGGCEMASRRLCENPYPMAPQQTERKWHAGTRFKLARHSKLEGLKTFRHAWQNNPGWKGERKINSGSAAAIIGTPQGAQTQGREATTMQADTHNPLDRA